MKSHFPFRSIYHRLFVSKWIIVQDDKEYKLAYRKNFFFKTWFNPGFDNDWYVSDFRRFAIPYKSLEWLLSLLEDCTWKNAFRLKYDKCRYKKLREFP